MKKILSTLILVLALISSYGWSQSRILNKEIVVDCPSQPITANLDSISRQIAVDSALNKASGHWQLVQIRAGWSTPRAPYWRTEMILNQEGKGIIYENGKQTLTYKLGLSIVWNHLRCTITEESKPFFRFHRRTKGTIRFCDQTLIIDQNLGDGEVFVFKRIGGDQK